MLLYITEVFLVRKKYITTLLIIFVLSISQFSLAESLNLDSWNIDAGLESNGDLTIEETLKTTLDENSDLSIEIKSNTIEDGAEEITIKATIDGKEVEFTEDENAAKGSNDVFKVTREEDKTKVEIFSTTTGPAEFKINYILKNQATIHKNTGELLFDFTRSNLESKEVSSKITLPKDGNEGIYIFNHGKAEYKLDGNSFQLDPVEIGNSEEIKGRILFPKEYILYSNNIAQKSLDEILAEEGAGTEASPTEENSQEAKEETPVKTDASSKNNKSLIIGGVVIVAIATFVVLSKKKK